jgi:DNA-binding CsgD family transcriptional regulator
MVDIAVQLGWDDEELLGSTPRTATFIRLLDNLAAAQCIAVIEDLHWSDDGTLDFVRYLGRRIHEHPVLLLLTYRDDELGAAHPLRALLGDLATAPWVHRLPLRPLGVEAVRELALDSRQDPEALHRMTAGNPFYVTEILASETSEGLPESIRDAVLARVSRLSPSARAALDVAAVAGQRVPAAFLAQLLGAEALAIDECMDVGVFTASGSEVSFRHELARQAVLNAIPPARRVALHGHVLDALRTSGGGSLAALAEHAHQAGDDAAVLELAPRAAREAAGASAHRQAAALFALVLTRGALLAPDQRAELLEEYAYECSVVGLMREGIEARLEAIAIWRQLEEPLRISDNYSQLVSMHFPLGNAQEAEDASRRAIEIAEPLGPSRELARAYRTQATLRMLCRDLEDALAWGHRAVNLAESLDDEATLGAALNAMGSAWMFTSPDRGVEALSRSLALAEASGLETQVANAYGNLGSGLGEVWEHQRADVYLEKGIAYSRERDLDSQCQYMLAWRALTQLHLGNLDAAGTFAVEALRPATVGAISKIMALLALGRLRARRGDPGAWSALDEALQLAEQTQTLQRIAPVRAARAEAAWLEGDDDRTAEEASAIYPLAMEKRNSAFAGELAYWLFKAGREVPLPDWAAPQFALQIKGDWQAAAKAWARLGCPYEQFRALAEGDDAACLDALEGFTRLGTQPAAERTRRELRARGVRGVPRGPRASTMDNVWGLTAREQQVLDLLALGLTNSQISRRLTLSTRTVEHHVSAVLLKLGVGTRGEAAALVRSTLR